jgi:ABC-type lipoprotein export system ATPase subunit
MSAVAVSAPEPSGADTLYRVEDLRFSYALGRQRVEALSGVSFAVPQGSFLCLSGPSGSGKTTLLNVLGLIEPMQEGRVTFDGLDLSALSEPEKNRIRRHALAFVFQRFHLIPVLRADENVEYFLARQGVPRRERAVRVREALESVGLWEHRRKRPGELSGGQLQRVAVARALAKRPRVIIADEPTASLDQKTGREIMGIFEALNRTASVTLILSSHDPMVQQLAHERLTLRDGRLA